MKSEPPMFSFYIRLTAIILLLFLIIVLLSIGNKIIMPLFLALLFAIQLRPLVNFFNKKLHFAQVPAVLSVVILFVIFIGSIIFFISWQVSDFTNDIPAIKHNLNLHYQRLQQWVQETFHISYTRQEKYVQSLTDENIIRDTRLVAGTLTSFTGAFLNMLLVPVYVFLILLYQNLFKKFLVRLVAPQNHGVMLSILAEIKIVIQRYLTGLLVEMGLIALLTSAGLLLIGVHHAILLGAITAVLNLIPYVGIITAGIITLITALAETTDIGILAGVVGVNLIVQLIDNNLLVPRIIASKVRINALASIIGVFIGAELAGAMGMFLAIPFIAILKVIFDRIEDLRPWGYLMGDDRSKIYHWEKMKSVIKRENEKTEEEKVAEQMEKKEKKQS